MMPMPAMIGVVDCDCDFERYQLTMILNGDYRGGYHNDYDYHYGDL